MLYLKNKLLITLVTLNVINSANATNFSPDTVCQDSLRSFIGGSNNIYEPVLKDHLSSTYRAGASYFTTDTTDHLRGLLKDIDCDPIGAKAVQARQTVKANQQACEIRCPNSIGTLGRNGQPTKLIYYTVQPSTDFGRTGSQYFIFNMYPD